MRISTGRYSLDAKMAFDTILDPRADLVSADPAWPEWQAARKRAEKVADVVERLINDELKAAKPRSRARANKDEPEIDAGKEVRNQIMDLLVEPLYAGEMAAYQEEERGFNSRLANRERRLQRLVAAS